MGGAGEGGDSVTFSKWERVRLETGREIDGRKKKKRGWEIIEEIQHGRIGGYRGLDEDNGTETVGMKTVVRESLDEV